MGYCSDKGEKAELERMLKYGNRRKDFLSLQVYPSRKWLKISHCEFLFFLFGLHKDNNTSKITESDWSLSLLLPHLLALPNIRHCAKFFAYIIPFTSHTRTYEIGTINILTSYREK